MANPPIAMRKELTFYPETERTRDLVYSEQSSCDRSLHLLLQDNTIVPYEFLLKTYREIVTRYLSSAKLDRPRTFIEELVVCLEEMSRASNISLDDLKGMGFHLLLRSADGVHLLTLNDRDVHVCSDGEMISLAEIEIAAVERLRIGEDGFQTELFAHRLRDLFVLFRLETDYLHDRDIALGCREQEKGAVLEVLSDPAWSQFGVTGSQQAPQSIKSKFISRRILVVGFEAAPLPAEPIIGSANYHWGAGTGGNKRRRGMVIGLAAAAVAVLIGILWIGEFFLPTDVSNNTDPEMIAAEGPDRLTSGNDSPSTVQATADGEERVVLAERWKNTYEDQVTSSPVVYRDWVIFGCRDGNVYSLERGSGETFWKFPASAGVGASPVIYEDNVIVADYNGNVYCVHAGTGKQVWSRKLPMKIVSTPHVSGDRVVIGCYDEYAYCLSPRNGDILWKRKTKGLIRGSAVAGGGLFVVPSYDGYVYALAGATGQIEWRANLGGSIAGTPAVGTNTIVAGAPDGTVYAIEPQTGTRTWWYTTGAAVKSSIAIASGGVFVGSNDSHIYRLNLADGSLVWKYKTGDVVLSKPHVKDGVVYVGSYDGFIYALDAATGALRDKFDTGGAIFSSPAVDDEHVYFGNNRGDFTCLTYHAKKSS
ncbi:MAG: PQQ-binding-like beta-propeller repeat protein [Candidatus Latescibacterota bacterium]|nr:MAG: PQQ-binding-like beta-propeller repeat protein [Candidatus Latescibacterota bacterium]